MSRFMLSKMNGFNIHKFKPSPNKFNRTTNILIGGVTAIGSIAGLSCAYIYYVIESVIVSK